VIRDLEHCNYLDATPDAKWEPYTCTLCGKKCSGIINDKYCIKCIQDMDKAKDIFNSDKSPLDFMVVSGGSVRLAPDHCERCSKKFRFYRKRHIVYDKVEQQYHRAWKDVCIDCINLKSDAF